MPKASPCLSSPSDILTVHSLIDSMGFKDINDIFNHMVEQLQNPPSRSTFYRWVQIGHKFSHLANGGSFYVLLLIAALDLRTVVAGLKAQVPWEVGKMLWEPETCSKLPFKLFSP